MKASVIMPVERVGHGAETAIRSVMEQDAPFDFELIIVSAVELELPQDDRVRNVVEPNRNPATRRNRAVSVARGELLAFIDDDAVADRRWLATAAAWLDAHPEALAVGGPDAAPAGSPPAELVSETLLAAPFIGSGIACHEDRSGIFAITSPSDVALVNLIVRSAAFTGFDESIGYIGEDSALVDGLMRRGSVTYHEGVRVGHRRRPFPGPYLRQRWRYRVKTGELLVRGSAAHRGNRKIRLFLAAGTVAILFAPLVAIPYYLLTLAIGIRTAIARGRRAAARGMTVETLPAGLWLLLPFAFAAHHAVYYFGILTGVLSALGTGRPPAPS